MGTSDKRKKLTPKVIKLLGCMSDDDLAKCCGRPRSTIRTARLARGIEAFIKKQELGKEFILLLGTMTDSRLAALADCNESTIRSARTRRGIGRFVKTANTAPQNPSVTPPPTNGVRLPDRKAATRVKRAVLKRNPELDPKLLECLGTMEDGDVGEKFGMSRKAICNLRNKHGIQAFDPTTENELMLTLLGTQKDECLARRFGKSPKAVARLRAKFGIPRYVLENDSEILKALGKISDAEVARRFGCSTVSVATLRAKHDISRFADPCLEDGPKAQPVS